MELSASTARPLTPSLCPPFWLARGRTAHVSGMRDKRYHGRVASRNRTRALGRMGGLTIADPLPRLTGHLVADQNALPKPILHVTVVEGARRGWSWGRGGSRSNGVNARRHSR